MFKKYFQDVIRTLLKESQKHQPKQSNIRNVKFEIRQTTDLVKPEPLANSRSNENCDHSADSLRLTILMDALLKKFVNPKLDLLTTLEQIKAIEAQSRNKVMKSMSGFLKFQSRSRIPALPATSSTSRYDKPTSPEEITIGWTGQPTVNRITCNVETSSRPRGLNYDFLTFQESKDFKNCHPPPTELVVVRLRKSRTKSRDRRRRKMSSEATPTPESTLHARANTAETVKKVPRVEDQLIQLMGVGKNVEEHLLKTEYEQLTSTTSKNLVNKKLMVNRSVQDGRLDLQSKDEKAQDTDNELKSSQQTGIFGIEPEIPQNISNNTFSKQKITFSSVEHIPTNPSMESAHAKMLESNEDGKRDNRAEYDEYVLNHNFVYNNENFPGGADSNKLERHVVKSTSLSEINKRNELNSQMEDTSTHEDDDLRSRELNLPNQTGLSPGISDLKGSSYTNLEQRKTPVTKGHSAAPSNSTNYKETPKKNKFLNIERNDFINRKNIKNEFPSSSNDKIKTSRYSSPLGREVKSGMGSINNKLHHKSKNKISHSKLKNKAILNSVSAHAFKSVKSMENVLRENGIIGRMNKQHKVHNNKSDSNLNAERNKIEGERQFSKSSLSKFKTNKISSQSNYVKKIHQKTLFKSSHRTMKEQDESSENLGAHEKNKLPKLVKMPENVRHIISKNVNFKAGYYKPLSKHFLSEKFPSTLSLVRKKREVSQASPSKHSMDLDVNTSCETSKKNINKQGIYFLSKQDSTGKAVSSQRPRTAFSVKGIKKNTKVVRNFNASLPNLNAGPDSFIEVLQTRGGKGHKILSDYKNSSNNFEQNEPHFNNPKYSSNLKLMHSQKNKPISQPKYKINRLKKNITSNLGKTSKPIPLNETKERRRHSMRLKPNPIVLKMYGRGKESKPVTAASDIHPLKSVGLTNSQQQQKTQKRNRLSQPSYPNDNLLKHTNSSGTKQSNGPITNVHVRRFSTNRTNSFIIHEQQNKLVSIIMPKSTPLLSNNKPVKDEGLKKPSVIKLRKKTSHDSNKVIFENKGYMKKGRKAKRTRIKNEVFAKEADTSIIVSNQSERDNKLRRKNIKKSLKRELKPRQTVAFEKNKKVHSLSVITDQNTENKEPQVEVLFQRQLSNSKNKLNCNDSETSLQIDLANINNLPGNELGFERPILPTKVISVNPIPSQMIQNVLDNSARRINLSPNKVLLPRSTENIDKPRRWKSRVDRLSKLRFYKTENVLCLNQQLAKTSSTKNTTIESSDKLAQCVNYKSVISVDNLSKDLERLATNINEYRFPRQTRKYTNSYFSSSQRNKFLDTLGGYYKIINKEPKLKGKTVDNKIKYFKVEADKEGVKFSGRKNQTLSDEGSKLNLALLHLDELSKYKRSTSMGDSPDRRTQKIADALDKTELSENPVDCKGCTSAHPKLRTSRTRTCKYKSTIDHRMDTIVSKLLSQAKEAEAPKTRSVDRCDRFDQFNPILQQTKSLKSILKYYKPESFNAKIHVSPSNNDKSSSNISSCKVPSRSQDSLVKNINKNCIRNKGQFSEIRSVDGTKIKIYPTKPNCMEKPEKLNKKLGQLLVNPKANQNNDCIKIEPIQVTYAKIKTDKTTNNFPATPTLDKLIQNISKSKGGYLKHVKSNATSKINSLNYKSKRVKNKNNENREFSKTLDASLVSDSEQNRNVVLERKLIPIEEKRSIHVKKPNINRKSDKIKNETSTLTKEAIDCTTGTPISSTLQHRLRKEKMIKVKPQIMNTKNKPNQKSVKQFTLNLNANKLFSNTKQPNQILKFNKEMLLGIYDSKATTTTLNNVKDKHMVRDRSCSVTSNNKKDRFAKNVVNPITVSAPKKQIPKLQEINILGLSNSTEAIKSSEKRSIGIKSKKKTTTIITPLMPIKSLSMSSSMPKISNLTVTKETVHTQLPVKDCKISNAIKLVPPFMDSKKLRTSEHVTQKEIQKKHRMAVSFHGLPSKVKESTHQGILKADLKEPPVSDKVYQPIKIKNLQIQEKNLKNLESNKNKSNELSTSRKTAKQVCNRTTMVTQEMRTSYDRSVDVARDWFAGDLEPGFI